MNSFFELFKHGGDWRRWRNDYQHRLKQEAADAQANAAVHVCIAHDWGSSEWHGALLAAHSIGDPSYPEKQKTPVTVDWCQRFEPGTPEPKQIEVLAKVFKQTREDWPQVHLHYTCSLDGYGQPGFANLRRGQFLVGVIHEAVTLRNGGAYERDTVYQHQSNVGKEWLINSARSAVGGVVKLPPTEEMRALRDQLLRYRLTATKKLPPGAQADRDSVSDDLVVAFGLAVFKLQARRRVNSRYAMGFLSEATARNNYDDDGLVPLLPSFRLD